MEKDQTERSKQARPDWVSDELLVETKSLWRTEYDEDLTAADAIGLWQTMEGVFEFLRESDRQNDGE